MPPTFWDNAFIGEGAVELALEPNQEANSDGTISRTFVLGGEGGNDRVVIYSPGTSGFAGEDIQITGW